MIVSWDESPDAAGYMIYRGSDESGYDSEPLLDSLLDGSSYEDCDVEEGLVYWYWIQAYNTDDMASVLSDPVPSPKVSFALQVPGQYGTIQEAIDASEHGDTIVVAPGRYVENLQLRGKNITLTSTDPTDPDIVSSTIVDGNEADAVIRVHEGETDVTITGFTITNGVGATGWEGDRRGGGINIRVNASGNHTFTVTGNVLRDNTAEYGGGIYVLLNSSGSSTLLLSDNTIEDNTADYDGGGIYSSSGGTRVIMTANTVSNNSAIDGGGVYING